jgi:hypothetical protein
MSLPNPTHASFTYTISSISVNSFCSYSNYYIYCCLQIVDPPEPGCTHIPDCYEPGNIPSITASFVYNDGVDGIGGRGYRIGTIGLPRRYLLGRDKRKKG